MSIPRTGDAVRIVAGAHAGRTGRVAATLKRTFFDVILDGDPPLRGTWRCHEVQACPPRDARPTGQEVTP